jgi:hypothetical protein
MRIVYWFVGAGALIAALAAAQMPQDAQPNSGNPSDPPYETPTEGPADTPATAIPEIPAGDDPMDRRPDPAAGTAAAAGSPQSAGAAAQDSTTCKVRRAATDTGFIVVCE